MAAEVPQVPEAMDGPPHRGEEAADALARGLVASLATPLERIGCDDNAHGDVAVEGAEGEEASSSSCCVQPLW